MQFSWAISFLCTYMCILSQSISSHFWVLRAPPWHWLHGLVQSSSCSAHLFHPVPDQGDVNYLSLWVKQLMGSTLLRNINKVRAHSSNSFGFIICFWGANFYMLLYVMICSKSLVPFEKKRKKEKGVLWKWPWKFPDWPILTVRNFLLDGFEWGAGKLGHSCHG